MSGCAAFVKGSQLAYLDKTVLLYLYELIVTLLCFVIMKATQILNMLGVEPVSPRF